MMYAPEANSRLVNKHYIDNCINLTPKNKNTPKFGKEKGPEIWLISNTDHINQKY